MRSSQGINLNANAGVQMPMTSKSEFFKYIDCVNPANNDLLTQRAVKKQQELRCLTAKVLSGRDLSADCSDLTTIITSGGSEANCLAIKAVAKFYQCSRNADGQGSGCQFHIITSAYEHKSVLKCLEQMQLERVLEVSLAVPDYKGRVNAQEVAALIKPNTVLITLMNANNEVGTDNTQQLIELGQLVAQENAIRKTRQLPRIYFHSDCVQTFAKYPGIMEHANLDMASCSYYKVYGANRIGALVIRGELMQIVRDHPLVNSTLMDVEGTHGGTQSLAAAAASLHSLMLCLRNRENKNKRLASLRQFLSEHIQNTLTERLGDVVFSHFRPDTEKLVKNSKGQWHLIVFSHPDAAFANTFMFSFVRKLPNRLDAPCGQKIVDHAAQNGIIIATGSACGSTLPSEQRGYVLQSMGVPDKLQQSAVRVSFSDFTTKHHIRLFTECLADYLANVYSKLPSSK